MTDIVERPEDIPQDELEAVAKAIYELDPFYEAGEYVDHMCVSPGGTLTWEQACQRDAEFADVSFMIPVTKFARDAARVAILAERQRAAGEIEGLRKAPSLAQLRKAYKAWKREELDAIYVLEAVGEILDAETARSTLGASL